MKPLENMIVLDFSQYLAGPSAALRLADMGARVIKIERPGSGDGSRQMKLHNLDSMGDSVLFQTINRNKQSFCADLKSPEDMNMVKKLIRRSDVMIENFRPGVMKKIGLDYETVKSINPRIRNRYRLWSHRPMEQKTGTGPSGSIHFRAGMAQR